MLLTKYYSGDQMKENEMGRSCGKYGEENAFRGRKPAGKRHLENLNIEGRIILKYFLNRVGRRGMDLSG
jgi:hypothetical protein